MFEFYNVLKGIIKRIYLLIFQTFYTGQYVTLDSRFEFLFPLTLTWQFVQNKVLE